MKQELADRLEAVAKQQNRSVEDLLATYIPGFIPAPTEKTDQGIDHFMRELDQWAESFPDTLPLSDEAISRDSIYGDR